MPSLLKIKNAILLAFILILSFSMGVVSSTEKGPINTNTLEVDKWASEKEKLVERAICYQLETEVEFPKNPSHYSSYQLSYEVVADDVKKFRAPLMLSTTRIPYKEKDSLQNVPTPSIDSLSCTKTVETWRAMYEYKTIPYIEVERRPINDFFMGLIDAVKKIFNWTLVALFVVAVFGIGSYSFYSTIKLTKKGSEYSLIGFVLVCFFPISPIAIAPLYFVWAVVLGNSATLLGYFLGCLMFVFAMTSTYIVRKYM